MPRVQLSGFDVQLDGGFRVQVLQGTAPSKVVAPCWACAVSRFSFYVTISRVA